MLVTSTLAIGCGGDIEIDHPQPPAPLGADAGIPTTPVSTDLSMPPPQPAPPAPPAPPTQPTPPPAEPNPCAAEETPFQGACYTAPGLKWLSFETAKQICAARGAQVASLLSKAENDFAFGLLAPLNQMAFIGLRRTGGTFGWLDGQPMGFQNWAPGEPNNDLGKEDCVIMWGPHLTAHPDWQGKWNDLDCDGKVDTVICKRIP